MVEVMQEILETHAASIGVCTPAKVESYDRVHQTVEASILTRKSDNTERPVIPNAPVIFPGAYWDIQVGEVGILVIADEDWRTWWRTGQASRPEALAVHDLSSAFFIPGLRSSPDSRTIPVGAAVLEKPIAGGTVRLGDQSATKAVVHEELLTILNTLLTLIQTWANLVDGIILTPPAGTWATTVTPTVTVFSNGVLAGNWESPSVKVED